MPVDVRAGARRMSAEAWSVVALTALAAALRTVLIAHQSLWFDEAQAVHEARSSLGTMLHLWNVGEPNPPLYFVLLWPWGRVFGDGEVALRSFSALAGTATVPLIYAAGRELVSRRAGLCAALLATVNPFLIGYAQQAREYALLAMFATASLWLFARHRRTGRDGDLIAWAVASALAMVTGYFADFLVVGEAGLLLAATRRRAPGRLATTPRRTPVLLACLGLIAVEVALLPHLLGHASSPHRWIESAAPLGQRVRQVPVAFAADTLYKGPAHSYGLIGAAATAVVFLALLLAGAERTRLRGPGLAAGLGALVVFTPLLIALAGRDYYIARTLIVAWPSLAVLAGAACTAPRAQPAGALVAAGLVAGFVFCGVVVQFGSSNYREPDWAGVARALGPALAPRMIVAGDGTFATAPLAVYLPRVPWDPISLANPDGQDPQPGGTQTVSELDVVTSQYTSLTRSHRGFRVIAQRVVGGYRVVRIALAGAQTLTQGPSGSAVGLANLLFANGLVSGAALYQPSFAGAPG